MRWGGVWRLESVNARKVGWLVCGVGLLVCAVIGWAWVPWAPVAGGVPAAVGADTVFSARELARAEAYSATARWLSLSSYALALAALAIMGLTRWGERLTRRMPGPWWLQLILVTVCVLGLRRLITFPLSLGLRENRLEYGLTSQSLADYFRDVVAEFAVSTAVLLTVVITVVICARRWSRAWPAVAGSLLMLTTLAASFAYPLVIEPVFNDFSSLPQGPLRDEVISLAETEGVELDDVLVADASRRTTSLNAYVSGFGSTRRVVLYDNLISGVSQAQTLSVVAHELAHARHDDVLMGSALGAGGVLIGVGLLGVLLPRGRSVGSSRATASDPAVVPLLLAFVAIASVASAPIQSTISRQIETRADVEALVVTGDGPTLEALQRKLALRSLADPTPPAGLQWWFGTHPTVLERIGLAREFVRDGHTRSE